MIRKINKLKKYVINNVDAEKFVSTDIYFDVLFNIMKFIDSREKINKGQIKNILNFNKSVNAVGMYEKQYEKMFFNTPEMYIANAFILSSILFWDSPVNPDYNNISFPVYIRKYDIYTTIARIINHAPYVIHNENVTTMIYQLCADYNISLEQNVKLLIKYYNLKQ